MRQYRAGGGFVDGQFLSRPNKRMNSSQVYTSDTRPRQFPTTAAEWAIAFPGITAPTEIWPCQDLSASTVAGTLGGNGLTQANSVSYANAADYGRLAVGLGATNGRFSAANNTIFNITTDSVTVFCRFFCPVGTIEAVLMSKATTSGTGYRLFLTASETLQFRTDGPGQPTQNAIVTSTAHGATWCDGMGVLDSTRAEVRAYSTFGSDTTSWISDTNTSTTTFAFGDPSGLNSRNGMLFSYAAIWVGTALTQAEFDTIVAGTGA